MRIIHEINKLRNEINKIKTVRDLLVYIPDRLLQKSAYILLIMWSMSPIYIAIRSVLHDDGLDIVWHVLLQQIGYIGIILGILAWLKSRIKEEDNASLINYIRNNMFIVLLFLMFLWSAISCFFSSNIALSFYGDNFRYEGFQTYIAYFGIFCCGYMIRKANLVHRLILCFAGVATLLSLLVVIDNSWINEALKLTKNAAVFHNINHFGYYICLAMMAVITLFIKKNSHIALYLLYGICFAFMTAALVQNTSFGPYIAVIVGLCGSLLLSIWRNKGERTRIIIAIIIFILVSIFMNVFVTKHLGREVDTLISGTTNIIKGSEEAAQAGSRRWPMWTNGVRFALDKPIFGYGPDNLGEKYREVGLKTDRPHNEIIQFSASLGFPAAILYLIALGIHFIQFFRNRKRLSVTMYGVIVAVGTYFVSSMFGNTMYYTTPFYAIMLGISGGLLKSELSEQKALSARG